MVLVVSVANFYQSWNLLVMLSRLASQFADWVLSIFRVRRKVIWRSGRGGGVSWCIICHPPPHLPLSRPHQKLSDEELKWIKLLEQGCLLFAFPTFFSLFTFNTLLCFLFTFPTFSLSFHISHFLSLHISHFFSSYFSLFLFLFIFFTFFLSLQNFHFLFFSLYFPLCLFLFIFPTLSLSLHISHFLFSLYISHFLSFFSTYFPLSFFLFIFPTFFLFIFPTFFFFIFPHFPIFLCLLKLLN